MQLDMNKYTKSLTYLQKCLEHHYDTYRKEKITEHQYLALIKPIDCEIDKIELESLNYLGCIGRKLDA